jgi:hypothetical protein
VEHDIVIEAFAGQLPDPRDMLRGKVRAKPDDDVAAAVETEDKHILFGHRNSPPGGA